ncbi:hypothetical protein BCR42DRAFT_425477 [Absidia repens]|uniref:Uncharacterized protein n=1 Tax=Absidia repens TaxID=90262 RepID=A0A1X2I387_9FUNG|nr:hypothetical protein BCR42DRAFT_425477 [Absidia repens]
MLILNIKSKKIRRLAVVISIILVIILITPTLMLLPLELVLNAAIKKIQRR